MRAKSLISQVLILSAVFPFYLGAANFFNTSYTPSNNSEMIVQVIKIQSPLAEEELIERAHERADKFRAIPRLVQKY